jgi:hypothetical protein
MDVHSARMRLFSNAVLYSGEVKVALKLLSVNPPTFVVSAPWTTM